MNYTTLPTHLICNTCHAEFSLAEVFEQPLEFALTPAGNLCCPICCDGWLDWAVDGLEPFRAFVETLDL